MKRVWKIISRVLLALGLTVYIVVALVNYSIVQSFAGAVAGNYFSKEWGGELRIGSLHAMPFDHLLLDHVLWVSPTNDTIFNGEAIHVRFSHFPFDGHGLDLDYVRLKNAYYHFETHGGNDINLKFLIDYYKKKSKQQSSKKHEPFVVKAKTLIMDNVHYKMDLPDHRKTVYPYGVQIPHMEFFEINAKIKDVLVKNDDVTCRIVRFATRERSGFILRDLKGDVHVSPYGIIAHNMRVETGASTIVTDAELRYNTWKGINGYVSTVQHNAVLKEGTRVQMSDVAYWAPVLWGIDAVAEAEGTATGTIDSLTTDMMVRWGEASSALVVGTVRGLPRIDTTTFDVDIEHLRTNAADLQPLTGKIALGRAVEQLLEDMGTLNLSATVRGGIKDNAAVNMLADCRLGQISTDATLRHTPAGYLFTLDAGSDGLGLDLLRTEWLTRSGFDLSVDGKWIGELKGLKNWRHRLDLAMDGHLTNSVVKGHPLSAASINGRLKGGELNMKVESSDTLAMLSVELLAALADSTKGFNLDAAIDHLDLGLLPHPLATQLTARLKGNSLEEMNGTVKARGTRYGDMRVKNIDLTIETDEHGKDIDLESDLADVDIRGQFKYTDLPLIVKYFGQLYMPEMFAGEEPLDSAAVACLADRTLAYQVRWLDDGSILHGLVDGINIARGTRIDGSYNFGEQVKLVAVSDSVSIGSLKLNDIGINGRSIGDRYVLQVETQEMNVGRMELMDRVKLTLSSKPSLATAKLTWGNNESPSMGDLVLGLEGNTIQVLNPLFFIGDTPWRLSTEGLTLVNDGRIGIVGERISIESEEQQINANLSLTGQPGDHVDLTFNRFSLNLLSDLLLQDSPLDIRGDIGGTFALHGLDETPYFNANLEIDSCHVNEQALGTMQLVSNWNSELGMLQLDLKNNQVNANGWLELGQKDPGMTFDIRLKDFSLAMAKPLVSSFSSHVDGKLSGDFSVTGTVNNPLILGDAFVEDGSLKVDITNVTYRIADSIRLYNNTVTLKDFVIRDPQSNIALANGTIELTPEQELVLNLGVTTDNLMVLDRKSGEQFYGRLFASADGRVTGPVNHLNIDVRARTNPGCELTVPISYQQSVKSQNYISFVNDEPVDETHGEDKERRADFDLELDLNITPDVKLNLPMDFKEVGVNVGATGAGDLHLNLNGNGSPQVLGNYVISSGLMKVGLFSVYEKRFTIENGSNLNFQGNLPDARFDLQAVYSQRVNLSTLTGSLSSIDNTQKNLQVDNIISISGTLRDPKIGFDLRLPKADQSVEEEVFAYIDRNNERDMLNQTLSLLITGSFYNVNSNNSQTSGGADALGAVTSFVGNSLTDMVQFVDVNIDYKSANEYTNQQLDVNISKDWGRWYLESTLGYGGESRELEAGTVNGAVIDALIGYRLSSVIHLFAYNRTNTNDYTRIDLPYKQGAGLKLTKDFDRWSDLFKRKNKKKK